MPSSDFNPENLAKNPYEQARIELDAFLKERAKSDNQIRPVNSSLTGGVNKYSTSPEFKGSSAWTKKTEGLQQFNDNKPALRIIKKTGSRITSAMKTNNVLDLEKFSQINSLRTKLRKQIKELQTNLSDYSEGEQKDWKNFMSALNKEMSSFTIEELGGTIFQIKRRTQTGETFHEIFFGTLKV